MYQPPVVFQPQIGLTFFGPESGTGAVKHLPSAGSAKN